MFVDIPVLDFSDGAIFRKAQPFVTVFHFSTCKQKNDYLKKNPCVNANIQGH